MTKGHMHKIGTQFLVQTSPELIREVVPIDLIATLFGDYFQPSHIRGSGPFGIFPGLTTVPVFVANTAAGDDGDGESLPSSCTAMTDGTTTTPQCHPFPRTDLHCEPIGNVAVQLQGKKQWTLVSPKYSLHIQPAASPDGRAFFASYSDSIHHVPRYQITLGPGDALWVPTWWWHR
eukprot:10586744-Ditylum_brightwellii.AAC.1